MLYVMYYIEGEI